MSSIDKLAKALIDSTEVKEKKKTSAYDATAKVVKVEGGTAWVNIQGGVDQTPAKMVVNAKAGEEVRVHIAGGKAYVTGNATSPPTDDSYAKKAEAQAIRATQAADSAVKEAGIAHKAADSAIIDADLAKTAATNAQTDATTAKEAAQQAVADAQTAATAASNAATSASNAETSATQAAASASSAATDASNAATSASNAATSASNAATSASNAESSASTASASAVSAGQSASQAQAASEAAQLAALATITTDTLHYLATSASSGVTRETSGWTTTVQTMTSTNKYLWTYHTYTSASGSTADTDPVITGVYGEDGDDGATIWTTGTAPTTPNYTFTISNLSGVSGATPKVGDIIVYSYYRYTITSVSSTTVLAGSRTSIRGAAGASSKWYTGNKITGTSTTATIFSNSGISSAVVGDMYLNIETNNTYRCTTAGAASAAKWVYVDNIQGEQGIQGIQGIQGDTGVSVTAVQPQYYLSTSSSSATGGSWSNSLSYVVGKYIWTRDQISYSNNTTGYSTAIYNEALTQSCEDAAEALGLIEEQQEYFWHDSLGAHVLSDKSTVSGTRYRTDIKGAGLEIFEIDQTDKSVAKFGADGVRVGQAEETHAEVDFRSFKLIDKDDVKYFEVSDLRDEYGEVVVTQTFEITSANSGQTTFGLDTTAKDTSYDVYLNNQVVTTGITKTVNKFTFDTAPAVGSVISVEYTAVGWKAKAFTFGKRKSGSTTGLLSASFGLDNKASGFCSHVEGEGNTASYDYAHAEGYYTTSSGIASHSEGRGSTASYGYSHAEGYETIADGYAAHAEGTSSKALSSDDHAEGDHTEASGSASHAEGGYTEASGGYSHAEGYYTKARGNSSHTSGEYTEAYRRSQVAIGEYNIADTNGSSSNDRGRYVVIIGNGTADDARSNALTVDWTGDIQIGLPNYQTSGSTDKALYDAIVALGWTSDVIV